MVKLVLSAFFILIFSGFSVATKIEGKNKEYAGKKLDFFRFSDPVTQKKIHVFSLEADREGNFSADVKVNQTTFVFSDFGIYRGMIFLEPEKTVELLLPPFREKSFADSKNPYFKPVEFWFATKEGNRLNDNISNFDTRLNELLDRFFDQLYFNQSKSAFDSVSHMLENHFEKQNHPTFIQHKKLKLKALEADAFRLSPEKVTEELATTKNEFWNHPAFIELFEKSFTNKLSFEVRSATGTEIRQAVAAKNIAFFRNFLNEKYKISGTVADLALLKMLHDAFYSGDFSQKDILNMLSSSTFRQHTYLFIRETSINVFEKLEFLRKGSKAPVICLKNTDGHRVCTNEDSAGEEKFKYLIFADTEMIVCREHLKYLTRTQEQFQKYLEIIIVLRKTDLIEMKMFLDKENIPGIHLIDENDDFIEKYRVKSFPTCFLLNENHEVIFQQAKAPLDGFEQQFGLFLRQELFERQRNQSQ
ncbi:redoxin domain-containing protein [Mariniphaga sp.]|uniref:redoxin domain-containing protein n=1 Tax=Mariniphaga sp. TaxID=1954475 RepID=UPI00356A46BA